MNDHLRHVRSSNYIAKRIGGRTGDKSADDAVGTSNVAIARITIARVDDTLIEDGSRLTNGVWWIG